MPRRRMVLVSAGGGVSGAGSTPHLPLTGPARPPSETAARAWLLSLQVSSSDAIRRWGLGDTTPASPMPGTRSPLRVAARRDHRSCEVTSCRGSRWRRSCSSAHTRSARSCVSSGCRNPRRPWAELWHAGQQKGSRGLQDPTWIASWSVQSARRWPRRAARRLTLTRYEHRREISESTVLTRSRSVRCCEPFARMNSHQLIEPARILTRAAAEGGTIAANARWRGVAAGRGTASRMMRPVASTPRLWCQYPPIHSTNGTNSDRAVSTARGVGRDRSQAWRA